MACKHLVALAAATIVAAAPLSARDVPPGPSPGDGAETRYCLRIEAVTGSRVETVRCWTRAEWVEMGVDVEREWRRDGMRVIR